MGTTTFSGPIKAGTIKDTTGTTVGADIKNTGFVLMSQSKVVALTGATANTTVAVIPANSQVVEVFADVTVVSNDTGAANVSVGNASNATAYIAVSNAKVTGRLTAVNAAIISSAFLDVGTSDSKLTAVFQAGTGDGTTGSAVVTVYYLQDTNLA